MSKNKEQIETLINDYVANVARPKLNSYGFPTDEIKVRKDKESGSYKFIVSGNCDREILFNAVEAPLELLKLVSNFYIEPFNKNINKKIDMFLRYDKKSFLSNKEDKEIKDCASKIDKLFGVILNDLSTELSQIILNSLSQKEDLAELIPSKIRKNYKVSGDLAKVQDWKAKVYLANSKGKDEPDVGGWGDVGYTMLCLDTGRMIPIARSDEHHCGFDLILHLREKGLIKQGDWYPLFFNTNYVYNDEPASVARDLKAFSLWRSLGGENTIVTGTNRLRFSVTMDDYIKAKGKIKNANEMKKELLPIGSRFISALEKIASQLNKAREGKRVKTQELFSIAYKVSREISEALIGNIGKKAEETMTGILKAQKSDDLKRLEELLFSHDGLKNTIHIQLKDAINNDTWNRRDLEQTFGDIEYIYQELNRLGAQY